MDPFEKQLRDLPWKKPSKELRDRLFAQPKEETVVVHGWFRNWVPWSAAAAAAILMSAGLWISTLRPVADAPIAAEISTEENSQPTEIEIEIASIDTFFDVSLGTNDVWAGSLTMQIEAN